MPPLPMMPSNTDGVLGKERVCLCVWSAQQQGQDLIKEIKSQSNFSLGRVVITDQHNFKTSVTLCGVGAHEAALRLLPLRAPDAPWNNVSENNRDWACPRVSCVDLRINIRACKNCQHCGEDKPLNILQSQTMWKESVALGEVHREPGTKGPDTQRPSGVGFPPNFNLSSQPHANDERLRVTVWLHVSTTDDGLIVSKLQEVLSPCFRGQVIMCERYGAKAVVELKGMGAHQAVTFLQNNPSHEVPWRQCQLHYREWICPLLSCVGVKFNIDYNTPARPSRCQNCGRSRPKNLQDSAALWYSELEKSALSPNDINEERKSQVGNGRYEAGSRGSETQERRLDAQSDVETRTKRPRLSGSNDIALTPDLHPSLHLHANDERVRITVHDLASTYDDYKLVSKLKEVLSPCFEGEVGMCERYGTKAAIELKGMGAHQTLDFLRELASGPSQDMDIPWRECTFHEREWVCPMLSCVGVKFNIDYRDPTKPSKCKNCKRPRPKDVRASGTIWKEELTKMAMAPTLSSECGEGTSELPPRAISPSLASASRPRTASLCIDTYHREPRVVRPGGEFGVWFDAKVAAGHTSQELLCDNKVSMAKLKAPIKGLLSCGNHGRIWAFDITPGSGAKGWAWSDCVDSFVDVYLNIDESGRHAYEVIEKNRPCRMAYDLDMRTDNTLNATKDDRKMMERIVSATENLMTSMWACQNELRFRNEVLVAHGPDKRSYHIIMRAFDGDEREVLVKDFGNCKAIATRVDSILGEDIRVERVDGNSGKSRLGTTSFIDLSIYTKDRPFRLVASSKITSPERVLVLDGSSGSSDSSRDLRSMVKKTLVVPSTVEEINREKYIEIADDTTTSRNNVDATGSTVGSHIETVPCCLSITPVTSPGDELPLLDHGRGKVYSHTLGKEIARPFDRLLPWVRDLASSLPDAKQNGPVFLDARYERSKDEAYVHFTISRCFSSHCNFVGRAHKQNNIMVSIDLVSKVAYQRCWDVQCRDPERGNRKARQTLSTPPPGGALPSKGELAQFELECGSTQIDAEDK